MKIGPQMADPESVKAPIFDELFDEEALSTNKHAHPPTGDTIFEHP